MREGSSVREGEGSCAEEGEYSVERRVGERGGWSYEVEKGGGARRFDCKLRASRSLGNLTGAYMDMSSPHPPLTRLSPPRDTSFRDASLHRDTSPRDTSPRHISSRDASPRLCVSSSIAPVGYAVYSLINKAKPEAYPYSYAIPPDFSWTPQPPPARTSPYVNAAVGESKQGGGGPRITLHKTSSDPSLLDLSDRRLNPVSTRRVEKDSTVHGGEKVAGGNCVGKQGKQFGSVGYNGSASVGVGQRYGREGGNRRYERHWCSS